MKIKKSCKLQAASLTVTEGYYRIKLMEDYTQYELTELYDILSQVSQAIELKEQEEKKEK